MLLQSRQAHLHDASLLVTGAAGQVATYIRAELRANFNRIRLTDCAALRVAAVEPCEQYHRCDLANAAEVKATVRGVEHLVHLGAFAKDADIGRLAPANIHGATHLLDAAVASGVKRIVLVSSMHVLGMYRRDEAITPHSAPRPDSFYAITKLYAENLARLYHERHGLSVVIVRPGHVTPRAEHAEPGNWTSDRDLARLIVLALKANGIGCEVWHAVTSATGDDTTQNDLARRFGFQFTPSQAETEGMDAALVRWYTGDEVARRYRGGVFASGRAM